MLYSVSYQDKIPTLPPLPGLKIVDCESPLVMSILNQITLHEAERRLLNDNRAYVAYLNDIAVAFGWLALGKARIGELNHEFIVPMDHGYLWNFRTLPDFKGLGIYPRILQHILLTEQPKVERFWIMHAPENGASRRGILKAGFRYMADVSLLDAEQVIYRTAEKDLEDLSKLFGFNPSTAPTASCWNCSSPYMKVKRSVCCCADLEKICSHNVRTPITT